MDDNSQEIAGILRDLFRDYFDNKILTNVNQLWDHHVSIYEKMTYIKTKQGPFIREPRDQHKFDLFNQWCDFYHIMRDGVRIGKVGPEDQDHVGLIAERDLPEETAVVRLPIHVMVSLKRSERDEFSASLKCINEDNVLNAMDKNISIAMIVAHEYLIKKSVWKPYLDVLPQSYNTPLHYTIDELVKYKGTTMFEHTLRLYRSVVRVYIYYYLRLYNHNVNPDTDKFFLPGPINVNNFTFEFFCWCVSTTFSRTFWLATDVGADLEDYPSSKDLFEMYPAPFFLPFIDMANYGDEEFKPARMQLLMRTNQVRLMTKRTYKKGEEVQMFYGLRTDWNFLVYHGFLPERQNKGNFVQLKLELPGDPKSDLMKRKLRYLYKRNILPEYISTKIGRYVFAFTLMNNERDQIAYIFDEAIRGDMMLSHTSGNYDQRIVAEVNAIMGFKSEKRDPSSSPSALVSLNDEQLRALIDDSLLQDSTAAIIEKINTSTWHEATKALFKFALVRTAVTPYELEATLFKANNEPSELLIRTKEYIIVQLCLPIKYLTTGIEPEIKTEEPWPTLTTKELRKLDKIKRKKDAENLEKVAKQFEEEFKVKQVESDKKKKSSKKSKK